MTRRLSQATLNTYWDYDNPNAPTTYIRQSELRFISGRDDLKLPANDPSGIFTAASNAGSYAVFFQAPTGVVDGTTTNLYALKSLLNTIGYYVQFGSDNANRPPFLNSISSVQNVYRYRLLEMVEPVEDLTIYKYTSYSNPFLVAPAPGAKPSTPYTGSDWYTIPLANTSMSRVLAQNILALVVLPKLSDQEDPTRALLAPNYYYTSAPVTATYANPAVNPKNQLPPTLLVTMVALSENSAKRIQTGTSQPGAAQLGYDITTLFKNATSFDADLKTVEKGLQGKRLQYRIFTSEIQIVGAKWSRLQTN